MKRTRRTWLCGATIAAIAASVPAMAQETSGVPGRRAPPPRSTENNFRRPIRNSAG